MWLDDEGKIVKNKDTWTFEKPIASKAQSGFNTNLILEIYKSKKRIKKNEGYSKKPYKDQLGFYTIGFGH